MHVLAARLLLLRVLHVTVTGSHSELVDFVVYDSITC